ncbi:MAG: hypothetical protein RLQ12_02110 [Cyclobacteriaceae bacterium]
MNRLTLIVVFCMVTSPLLAQKYGTTLGLRLANDDRRMLGVTMQQRIFNNVTMEGIVQSDFDRNTTFHGLVKNHIPLITKRLNIYTGAGLSFGVEESFRKDPVSKEVINTYGNETFGADLMIGAEITLLGACVSLDYKPNINISGRDNWFKDQVGISVRKVLIKDNQRKKKIRKKARTKRKKERQKARDDS